MRHRSSQSIVLSLVAGLMLPVAARAFDVVLAPQGEYLDAYLTTSDPPTRKAFIVPDDPAHGGRHINGKVCLFPSNAPAPYAGKLVAADDTFDEVCDGKLVDDADTTNSKWNRCANVGPNFVGTDPPGWSVLNNDGSWTGRVIHAKGCDTATPQGGGHCDINTLSVTDPTALLDGRYDPSEPTATQGTIDPQGCFFDNDANLWGTDVGHDGDPTDHDGALIVFFAASDYKDYCFVDRALLSPAAPVYDASESTVYLSESGGGRIDKFTAPFPTSAADCATLPDHTVTVPATKTVFSQSPLDGTLTPAAMARKPSSTSFYVASVLLPGGVVEIDGNGLFSGYAVGPTLPNLSFGGQPVNEGALSVEGLDVDGNGTLYFADLNLQTDPTSGTFFSTGCGKMWKAAAGGQPVLLADHLRFPDGVTVVDSEQLDLTKLTEPTDASFCTGE